MDNLIKKIKTDKILNQINVENKDYNLYLVGGFLRDTILNKDSFDRDLIIENTSAYEFSKDLADRLQGHFIILDQENQIYRIVLQDKKNSIDIAKMQGTDIYQDLRSRDLTINSLCFDLKENKIIDCTDAYKDIKNKRLYTYNLDNFKSDPLRMLRVFRFASILDFSIDNNILDFIKDNYSLINNCAYERIIYELLKFFEGDYCSSYIEAMDKCNLLELFFPIIAEVKKIPPNLHHHLDLFHHSIETVRQLELIYKNSDDNIKKYFDEVFQHNITRISFLKLSGFLHDIGKPSTWSIEENTLRHRFIKHDEIGSKLVIPILRGLKFSKLSQEYISKLIKNHIYPSCLTSGNDYTTKAKYKFYRKTENFTIDVISLAKADRLSALGPEITKDIVNENINNLNNLLNDYFEFKNNEKPLEKLIDGIEIFKLLKLEDKKELSPIIKELKEAQLSGDVNNKEEAIDFLLKIKKNL